MSTPMKIVETITGVTTTKDLLSLSPLAARAATPAGRLLPPQPRFVIECVRVTCDRGVEQLQISCYRASDAGTGTACTTDAVDLAGGGQALAGIALKALSVAATKTGLLDSQQVSMLQGATLCDDEGDYAVLPGSHFIVRLDSAPTASSALTVEVEFRQE